MKSHILVLLVIIFILGFSVEVPAPHTSQILAPGLLQELKKFRSLQSLYICVTYEVMLQDSMTHAFLNSQRHAREKGALTKYGV